MKIKTTAQYVMEMTESNKEFFLSENYNQEFDVVGSIYKTSNMLNFDDSIEHTLVKKSDVDFVDCENFTREIVYGDDSKIVLTCLDGDMEISVK